MAKRILSDEDYDEWLEMHHDAETSVHMREKLLMDSYWRIEKKLTLLGATGIEDKLQEGVPNTIANLRSAGIVVWVLTGDKQETAINIAYSRDTAEQIINKNLEDIRHFNDTIVVDSQIVDGNNQDNQQKKLSKKEIIEN